MADSWIHSEWRIDWGEVGHNKLVIRSSMGWTIRPMRLDDFGVVDFIYEQAELPLLHQAKLICPNVMDYTPLKER